MWDGLIHLLEQLEQKETNLKRLSIDILWFHVTKKFTRFMDLNIVAPTIRELALESRESTPDNSSFSNFEGFDQIEALTILETLITHQGVQELREKGYLPNLKTIECDTFGMENTESDVGPMIYNFSASLVRIVCGHFLPGDSSIINFQTNFLSATGVGFPAVWFRHGFGT